MLNPPRTSESSSSSSWMPILSSGNDDAPSSLYGGVGEDTSSSLFDTAPAPTRDPRLTRRQRTDDKAPALDPRWKPIGGDGASKHGLTVRKKSAV